MCRASHNQRPTNARRRRDAGFTLVELMIVVLILGILVTIAIPVMNVARERSMQRTCFANQRTIAGAVLTWVSNEEGRDPADLEGLVDGDHPLIDTQIFDRPPRCPAAPKPADPQDPGAGEGAYTLDDRGRVQPCPFGTPAHGDIYN